MRLVTGITDIYYTYCNALSLPFSASHIYTPSWTHSASDVIVCCTNTAYNENDQEMMRQSINVTLCMYKRCTCLLLKMPEWLGISNMSKAFAHTSKLGTGFQCYGSIQLPSSVNDSLIFPDGDSCVYMLTKRQKPVPNWL